MSKFKNRFKVAEAIEDEGDYYFFSGYTSAETMPDVVLEELFKNIENSIEELDELIYEFKKEIGL